MKQLNRIRGRLIKKYPVKMIDNTLHVWLNGTYRVQIRRWRWEKEGVISIKYTVCHDSQWLFTVETEIHNETVDSMWISCGKEFAHAYCYC